MGGKVGVDPNRQALELLCIGICVNTQMQISLFDQEWKIRRIVVYVYSATANQLEEMTHQTIFL